MLHGRIIKETQTYTYWCCHSSSLHFLQASNYIGPVLKDVESEPLIILTGLWKVIILNHKSIAPFASVSSIYHCGQMELVLFKASACRGLEKCRTVLSLLFDFCLDLDILSNDTCWLGCYISVTYTSSDRSHYSTGPWQNVRCTFQL